MEAREPTGEASAMDEEEVREIAYQVQHNVCAKQTIRRAEATFYGLLLSKQIVMVAMEPLDSYSRMLLHRVADHFRLAHGSEGLGDERHLRVWKDESSQIPGLLVSDIINGEACSKAETWVPRQLYKRDGEAVGTEPLSRACSQLQPSLTISERKAAYDAARERIFAGGPYAVPDLSLAGKERLRLAPDVARRMIAHALSMPALRVQPVQSSAVADILLDGAKQERLRQGAAHATSGLEEAESQRQLQSSPAEESVKVVHNVVNVAVTPTGSSSHASDKKQQKVLADLGGPRGAAKGTTSPSLLPVDSSKYPGPKAGPVAVRAAQRLLANALGRAPARPGSEPAMRPASLGGLSSLQASAIARAEEDGLAGDDKKESLPSHASATVQENETAGGVQLEHVEAEHLALQSSCHANAEGHYCQKDLSQDLTACKLSVPIELKGRSHSAQDRASHRKATKHRTAQLQHEEGS